MMMKPSEFSWLARVQYGTCVLTTWSPGHSSDWDRLFAPCLLCLIAVLMDACSGVLGYPGGPFGWLILSITTCDGPLLVFLRVRTRPPHPYHMVDQGRQPGQSLISLDPSQRAATIFRTAAVITTDAPGSDRAKTFVVAIFGPPSSTSIVSSPRTYEYPGLSTLIYYRQAGHLPHQQELTSIQHLRPFDTCVYVDRCSLTSGLLCWLPCGHRRVLSRDNPHLRYKSWWRQVGEQRLRQAPRRAAPTGRRPEPSPWPGETWRSTHSRSS